MLKNEEEKQKQKRENPGKRKGEEYHVKKTLIENCCFVEQDLMASMCWVKDSFNMFFHWPASYKDKKDRKLRETILTPTATRLSDAREPKKQQLLEHCRTEYLVNFVRSINNIHLDFFMKICGCLQLLRALERKTSSILLVKYMFRRGHLA